MLSSTAAHVLLCLEEILFGFVDDVADACDIGIGGRVIGRQEMVESGGHIGMAAMVEEEGGEAG